MIFPKELLENTYPVFSKNHSTKSRILYVIVLCFIVVVVCLLPVIHTEIYFSSTGVIRSLEERTLVISPRAGYIDFSKISFNKKLQAGDTLLSLDKRRLDEQLHDLKRQISTKESRISDLNYLLFANNPIAKHLNTPSYRSDLANFLQRQQRIELDINIAGRKLKRQQMLFKEHVISKSEFESYQFDYHLARQEKALLIQEKKAFWDADRKNLNDELEALQNELQKNQSSEEEYILTTSMPGTLFKVKELQVGAYINQGEVLAEFSPESELVAEILVPTSKMGLLKSSQEVHFQIDAFNYRNWGTVSGEIIEMADDIEIINNQAVFRVIASLDRTELTLRNGTKGKLQKGLTFTSKFVINRRSLLDLLYDKTDDWINPVNQNSSLLTLK